MIYSIIISGVGVLLVLFLLLVGKFLILLVIDKNVGVLEVIQVIYCLLVVEGCEVEVIDSVLVEFNYYDVMQIVSQLGVSQLQMVVGIGGGSVLDVVKLLLVFLYFEVFLLMFLLVGEQL